MKMPRVALGFVIATVVACGGGSNGDDGPPTPDAPPGTPDAQPGGWQSLIEGDWSLEPNEEGYYCVYVTVPRDVYIKSFRPLIPNGTHHTVLTLYTEPTPADGVVPCGVGTNGQSMIYGSGVGSPDFAFPAGVGLHLTAGTRLLLNLHLYNATDGTLTGRSGTLFQEATAAEIQNEAELVLAGPTLTLNVPPGISIQSGTCDVNNVTSTPVQVFALSQHMHKLGTHMKSDIDRGGTLINLQDIDYQFESQVFHQITPIELRPGDLIRTHCTFDNDTGGNVGFGESSDDEMCFTDVFYYPAQGATFVCSGF